MSKTKKSLLLSCLSMLLCVTMLIGSTFAWFTDNATTGVNTIQAGTLDIGIYEMPASGVFNMSDLKNYTNLENEKLSFRDANGNTDILWEPGAEFVTQEFVVVNTGNLAAKAKILLNGVQVSDNKLMEVLDFDIQVCIYGYGSANEAWGSMTTLAPTGEFSIAANQPWTAMRISAKMDENAGNQYQGEYADSVGITIMATQDTVETDSNDNQYDAAAEYLDPSKLINVSSADELITAFATMENGDVVTLLNDIDMSGKSLTPVSGKGFTLNGNGHTISNLAKNAGAEKGALFVSHAGTPSYYFNDLTVNACSVTSTSNYAALFVGDADTSGNVTINNCHVVNCTVSSGKYAAAFVAYTAGYDVLNNGPVYGNYTITDCSVTGGSITGAGSTGAAIGHAGGNKATTNTITNLTVKNVAINGEDADHTGIVVGTAHVGKTIISGTGVENVTGNYNTAHNLYGRFVPAETGTLLIDGAEIS